MKHFVPDFPLFCGQHKIFHKDKIYLKLQLILEITGINYSSYLKLSYPNVYILAKNFRSAVQMNLC